jgi:hypothetical protein
LQQIEKESKGLLNSGLLSVSKRKLSEICILLTMPILKPHFNDGNQANPTPELLKETGRSFFIKSDQPTVENTEEVFEDLATVVRRWVPTPHLEITFDGLTSFFSHNVTRVQIGERCETNKVSFKTRESEKMIYKVSELSHGEAEHLKAVDFHVFNMIFVKEFHSDENGANSHLVFEYDEWKITLVSVRKSGDESKALMEQGYALTHVGRIERQNGTRFKFNQTKKLRESFQWFLSFVRGGWVGVDHFVGLGEKLEICYQSWVQPRISPGYLDSKWFPYFHSDSLEKVFPKFAHHINSEQRGAVLHLAVSFYIQANSEPLMDARLISAQIALEALSYSINDISGLLAEDAFEKLRASDRLRLVLVWAGIPLKVKEYTKGANTNSNTPSPKLVSGVDTIINLRNWSVHSTPKNRNQLQLKPIEYRHWAGELSLWYLELVLLKLFEYDGQYCNRMENGRIENLPWIK